MFHSAKNLLVKVNDQEILATEASLSYEASIEPHFIIGDQYTKRVTPTNLIQGNLNINYLYTGLDVLHSLKTINSGLVFDFGGIQQTGYLKSHSVRFNPHAPISCVAQISFYRAPVGAFSPIYINESINNNIIHVDQLEINAYGNELVTGQYTTATLNYNADIRPEFHIEDIVERRAVFGRKETTLNATINNLNPNLLVSGNKVGVSFLLKRFGEDLFSSAYSVTGHLTSKSFRSNVDELILNDIIIRQYELIEESTISGLSPNVGTIGDTITITGTNFLNIIKIYFDDLEASSFSILDDNTLQVKVPRLKSIYPKISLLTLA